MIHAHWRKAIGPLVGFALGVGASILAGAIIAANDPVWYVVENWYLSEETPGTLAVHVQKPCFTMVKITRDRQTNFLESIAVLDEHAGCRFRYTVRGELGVPEAKYSGGSAEAGVTWVDLKADGSFDERIDRDAERAQIYVSGKWIEATINDSRVADTDDGRFEFDPEAGEWRLHQRAHGASGVTEQGYN